MAKKRRPPATRPAARSVTAKRAARLYRLLTLLARGPQTRPVLIRRLKLGVRDFYRDLVVLQKAGISVQLLEGRYSLGEPAAATIERLPFPDPGLTLGEAQQLARGRTQAHRKLRSQIDQIVT